MNSNPSGAGSEVVIYLGTQKAVALEGSFEKGEPRILRHAVERHMDGFERGFVTDLEKAATSLERLMQKLGSKRPEDAPVYVVLGNSKLKSYTFSSSQYYQGMQRTVSVQEIRNVINQTRSVATLPLTEFVLQAHPESFIVNDLENVANPLGLEAHRLGVQLKIFTMNFEQFKNIAKAFETAELTVRGYFPKTLTASEAVLTEDEKDDGALLVDIGDDTASFVLWKDGALVDTRVHELGGIALTRRIAEDWKIDLRDAQKVKEQYGSLGTSQQFGEELIPLIERNGQGAQQIHRQAFQQKFEQYEEAWLAQVLACADSFAQENRSLHPHLVFTGGATTIDGFIEFLQKKFSRTARIGLTRKVEAPSELLVDPSLTGALGLFRWLDEEDGDHKKLLAPQGFLQKTLASARDWFTAYF